MAEIDTEGTFLATIIEHSLGVTKKGFPQLIARLHADQKFVGDTDGMKHFGLTEPGYVDWSSFNEDIVGYMVLFNSKDVLDDSTKMLNYDNLQRATGWDGASFSSLNSGEYVGKQVLIRIEAGKPYTDANGNQKPGGKLQVNWIDAVDASPERSLKALDTAQVNSLNSLLKINRAAKPAAAAKPVAAKPGKPAAAAAIPAPTAVTQATPSASASAAPSAPKPPKKTAKKVEAPAPAAEETTGEEVAALPPEVTKDVAWNTLMARKGTHDDTEVTDSFIKGCQAVGGETDDDDFTTTMWAQVRDFVLAELKI